MPKRLGFFTRLLDQGSAQTRYRLAAEQIRHAERLGFDSAWIAQHHFHEQEGGLPSPLVFLAHVAFVAAHPGVPRMLFGELQRTETTGARALLAD